MELKPGDKLEVINPKGYNLQKGDILEVTEGIHWMQPKTWKVGRLIKPERMMAPALHGIPPYPDYQHYFELVDNSQTESYSSKLRIIFKKGKKKIQRG